MVLTTRLSRTPVDGATCSQAVDIFKYLTPPVIDPPMRMYYWSIGQPCAYVFTLCEKVTYPPAEGPVVYFLYLSSLVYIYEHIKKIENPP